MCERLLACMQFWTKFFVCESGLYCTCIFFMKCSSPCGQLCRSLSEQYLFRMEDYSRQIPSAKQLLTYMYFIDSLLTSNQSRQYSTFFCCVCTLYHDCCLVIAPLYMYLFLKFALMKIIKMM